MKAYFHTTLADKALIVSLIVVSGALFVLIPRWAMSRGDTLEIRAGEAVVGRYSLDEDRTVEVPGPLGKSTIRIRDGQAEFIDSPCPHKTCVNMGPIGKEGGARACVPNEVVISVREAKENGMDAVSR